MEDQLDKLILAIKALSEDELLRTSLLKIVDRPNCQKNQLIESLIATVQTHGAPEHVSETLQYLKDDKFAQQFSEYLHKQDEHPVREAFKRLLKLN